MSSVQSRYAQRDNRIIYSELTGYITDNGTISGALPPSVLYHAAIATLDVTRSQLFIIDAKGLTLRGSGVEYLLSINFSQIPPPLFYPGFEINIVVDMKYDVTYPLLIDIQNNPSIPLDPSDSDTFIQLSNVDPINSTDTTTDYTYGPRVITLMSNGYIWLLKSTSVNTALAGAYAP